MAGRVKTDRNTSHVNVGPRIRTTLLVSALLGLGTAAGCDKPGGSQQQQQGQQQTKGGGQAVAVTVEPVRLGKVQRFVDVTGTLHGEEDASISAKVSGRIVAIHKDVGDRVAPGEVLAELEKTDYELVARQKELAIAEALAKLGLKEFPAADFSPDQVPTVQRARLQAENAEAKYKRGKQLHEQAEPLIADQDFADLETAAAVAKSNYDVELLAAQSLLAEARARRADLDLARQGLADATVHAPRNSPRTEGGAPRSAATRSAAAASSQPSAIAESDFAVSARFVSVGEYVKEGTPLFRLVDDDPIKLRAIAPERFVSAVRVGQLVRVRVEAYEEEFTGRVSRTNPQIDPTNRMFQFEVLVPNPKRLLKPGGFANGAVHTDMEEDIVFVPQRAVSSFAGVSKVFVVRDGKAAEAVVELGQRIGEDVEVVKGLKGDERIAVSGLNRLTNGAPVAVAQ